MKIFTKGQNIPSSEITSENEYLSRRKFLKNTAVLAAVSTLAACIPEQKPISIPASSQPVLKDELGNPAASYEEINSFNNYYEFSTGKENIGEFSKNFVTDPWTIDVDGLVNNPFRIGLEDILAKYTREERIYRLRCVERWSMVIPWEGFSLSEILQKAEPKSEAKFVAFQTIFRPEQMPNQTSTYFPWPYLEGLRLDEAMHELTTLATGIYGKPLEAQTGAPIRLVVPWKYGYKSIKSIVRITLTDTQPPTFWNTLAPDEYGFYSNVNPEVSHPRWSQATEQMTGVSGRKDTLLFNGYGEQVADLYQGMDLKTNY